MKGEITILYTATFGCGTFDAKDSSNFESYVCIWSEKKAPTFLIKDLRFSDS